MKIMPSRRAWRGLFRRIRIYVPVVLLGVVLLAVLLPISAPWAARLAEEQLERRFGVAVSFERMTVRLATGEAVARGLVVVAPDVDEPFRIELVRLSGSPAGLLAGDGSWPERVEIISPSPIRIARDERGVLGLQGAGRTLLVAAQGPRRAPTAFLEPAPGSRPERGLPKRLPPTPEVVLTNVQVLFPAIEPIGAGSLRIDRLEVARRLAPNAPVSLAGYGEAVAGGIERWRLQSTWVPGQDVLGLGLRLEGSRLGFGPANAPRAIVTLRHVTLDASLRGYDAEGSPLHVEARLGIGQFDAAEARVGGVRWDDRDLQLSLSGEWDSERGPITVRQLLVTAADLDASLSGSYRPEDGGIIEARAATRRIPGDLLDLGRAWLDRQHGILVEPDTTTATLALELDLRDLRPARPEYRPGIVAHLSGGGWTVEPRGWPAPVHVDRLDVRADSIGGIDIGALTLRLGDMRVRAAGRLPLTRLAEGDTSGTLRVGANGSPQAALQLAQELGLVTSEIVLAEVPLSLDVTLRTGAGQGSVPALWPQEGTLAWNRGVVRLLGLRDAIEVAPGAAEFLPGGLTLRQFATTVGTLGVRGSGRVDGDFRGALRGPDVPLTATLSLQVDGDLSDVLDRAARHVPLPIPANAVAGQFSADVNAMIPLARVADTDFQARLRLAGVQASFPIPNGTMTARDVALEAALDRDHLAINRLAGRIEDPRGVLSSFDLRGGADDEALRIEGTLDTDFGILEIISPREMQDLFASGRLPARVRAALIPNSPLEPAPDIISRWVGTLERRAHSIRLEPDAPLFADVRVDYLWEEPIRFFARDMPIPIENIRGNARFTSAEGVVFENILADAGSSRNIRASGRLTFGPMVLFKFTVDAPWLPITPWLSGWGEQPWARPGLERIGGGGGRPDTRLMTVIEGTIRAREGEFFNTFGEDLSASLRYEIWRGRPMQLELRDIRARAYGGRAEADARFELSAGRAYMELQARIEDADVQELLTDFLQRPDDMTGRITGEITMTGVLQEQPTYQGTAWLQLNDSSLLGGKVLRALTTALRPFTLKQAADTTISARLAIRDREIVVSDGVIQNPALRLTTDGVITFDARIWFRVTATFLDQLPVFGPIITALGSNVINPMVVGTIQEPKVIVRPLGMLEESRPSGMPMPGTRGGGESR